MPIPHVCGLCDRGQEQTRQASNRALALRQQPNGGMEQPVPGVSVPVRFRVSPRPAASPRKITHI